MTENRTVIAQFCDDFRQEIGNKFSLMGCYGTDLFVPTFPITLPKLCVFVYVRTPKDNPFETLTLRVMRAEQALATLRANLDRRDSVEEMPSWTHWLSMTGVLVMAPFNAVEPCDLRVQAETESEIIESGRFLVRKMI